MTAAGKFQLLHQGTHVVHISPLNQFFLQEQNSRCIGKRWRNTRQNSKCNKGVNWLHKDFQDTMHEWYTGTKSMVLIYPVNYCIYLDLRHVRCLWRKLFFKYVPIRYIDDRQGAKSHECSGEWPSLSKSWTIWHWPQPSILPSLVSHARLHNSEGPGDLCGVDVANGQQDNTL